MNRKKDKCAVISVIICKGMANSIKLKKICTSHCLKKRILFYVEKRYYGSLFKISLKNKQKRIRDLVKTFDWVSQ